MNAQADLWAQDGINRRLRERLEMSLRDLFEGTGYAPVEPPVLQPADPFLDLSGEDIRRRLYVFTDPGGREVCLRPDLTLPTCRYYLDRMPTGGPAKLSYAGPVFRFETDTSGKLNEFAQAGVENFGADDREAADAEVLSLAIKGLQASEVSDFEIELGDLGLFSALVDALDIPPAWRSRLKRHFWRPDYFRELIERLASSSETGNGSAEHAGLIAALGPLNEKQVRALIEDVLGLAQISAVGGRSVSEIAERFLEQAADSGGRVLAESTVELINRFLALQVPASQAVGALRELLEPAGVRIDASLMALDRRLELIGAAGVDLSAATFGPGFGRKLEYYTGFVFELRVPALGAQAIVAGGGRYDGLLGRLGAPYGVPAVGCAVSIERVMLASGANEAKTEGGAP